MVKIGVHYGSCRKIKTGVSLFFGYIPIWLTGPQTVTHPSTNRARRRVTTFVETSASPPSQPCLQMLQRMLVEY